MAGSRWIPAFAGMTEVIRTSLDHTDAPAIPPDPEGGGQRPAPSGTDRLGFSEQRSICPSFPRKREPSAFAFHGRTSLDPRLRRDDGGYPKTAVTRIATPPLPRTHQTRRAADKDVRRFPPRQDGESENPDSSTTMGLLRRGMAFLLVTFLGPDKEKLPAGPQGRRNAPIGQTSAEAARLRMNSSSNVFPTGNLYSPTRTNPCRS